eukprot:m.96325 g.96325  ORF g.96325 m.96325 type:complete len:974 (-) comp8787_c0_seq1:270-3191(-)
MLSKLALMLEEDPVGKSIVDQHQCFKGFNISMFNSKTSRHGIDYVLSNIRAVNTKGVVARMASSGKGVVAQVAGFANKLCGKVEIDTDALHRQYNSCEQQYDALVRKYLAKRDGSGVARIADSLRQLVRQKRRGDDPSSEFHMDRHKREALPTILAHIFAMWTLQNATHYFDADGLDNRESYLLKPHAAQIISIFRLLGNDRNLVNHLVQIGTGEGKSVTIAVTAATLALFGLDVSCACYSDYLSTRDHNAFEFLFSALGVQDLVHYGTFTQLCERQINAGGSVRDKLEGLMRRTAVRGAGARYVGRHRSVLIIDEVDVFFNEEFWGNSYTPSLQLKSKNIEALVLKIWNERTSLSLRTLQASAEYNACIAEFPEWKSLLEHCIRGCYASSKNPLSQDHVVKDDRIAYRENDGIAFNISYGYSTMFTYVQENLNGNISEQSMREHLALEIHCGNFSFARIPERFFCVLGVSGTLETLTPAEQEIVRDEYKIYIETYMPSVFGATQLKFAKEADVSIEQAHDFFNAIVRQMKAKWDQGRAVMIFFEDRDVLLKFFNCSALVPFKESVSIMTEDSSLKEKERQIQRATTTKRITLLTKVFGRGTDFVCRDQAVLGQGGVHVIQTFLSVQLSEEVQVKGRTARQGDVGSYEMVLSLSDLETFDITEAEANSARDTKEVYALLDSKRTEFFKKQHNADKERVELLKEQHNASQNFVHALDQGHKAAVMQYLLRENRSAGGPCNSKTLVLMDATGSMSSLLQKAKNTVNKMFAEAVEVLEENGIDPSSFAVQYAVYRNYNVDADYIVQHSPWETDPVRLEQFLKTISVRGGMGNEAIELGLAHAHAEAEQSSLSQVILIGDAPANTPQEVLTKRASSLFPWDSHPKYGTPTNWQNELQYFQQRQLPVHAFYVADKARRNFQEIAASTQGRCERLDIDSQQGASRLTELVTEEILRNVGGAARGEALVQAYRAKKSYTS